MYYIFHFVYFLHCFLNVSGFLFCFPVYFAYVLYFISIMIISAFPVFHFFYLCLFFYVPSSCLFFILYLRTFFQVYFYISSKMKSCTYFYLLPTLLLNQSRIVKWYHTYARAHISSVCVHRLSIFEADVYVIYVETTNNLAVLIRLFVCYDLPYQLVTSLFGGTECCKRLRLACT